MGDVITLKWEVGVSASHRQGEEYGERVADIDGPHACEVLQKSAGWIF